MKKITPIILLFMTILVLPSCTSYVERMHHEMSDRPPGPVGLREKGPLTKRRLAKGPSNSLSALSARSGANYSPQTKRNYSNIKRRHQSKDLDDNAASESLWTQSGQSSFLFSKNNYKKNGDIVIINVQDNIKKQIAAKVGRHFPANKSPKSGADKSDSESAGEGGPKDKKESAQNRKPAENDSKDEKNLSSPDAIYDKVSAVVVEEIDSDHLLLKGRKDILYKTVKRTVEVEALVARRSVSDDDSILSSDILESNIFVVR